MRDPQTGKMRHMSPSECWDRHLANGVELVWLEPAELEDCFRPYEIRTVSRCEIKLFKSTYFNKALTHYHEQEVQVGYDIHDASRVYVRDLDGHLICTAGLDANKTDYFPKSALEEARERRARGRVRRLETHRQEALEELSGRPPVIESAPLTEQQQAACTRTVEALEGQSGTVITLPQQETREDRFVRALNLEGRIAAGEYVDPEQACWLGGYQTTAEYKAQRRIYENFGPSAFGIASGQER
jgi:putative transposase